MNQPVSLVLDQGNPESTVTVPTQFGLPKVGQLEGTKQEQLIELAGRGCYDSLGKGRTSEEFHAHLLQVGHFSVHEHAWFCIGVPWTNRAPFIDTLSNNYGAVCVPSGSQLLVFYNLRVILDWMKNLKLGLILGTQGSERKVFNTLVRGAQDGVPSLIDRIKEGSNEYSHSYNFDPIIRTIPLNFTFVSLHMVGSRAWSHEQVRHRFLCAVSQRSTRYVDESKCLFAVHPVLEEIYGSFVEEEERQKALAALESVELTRRTLYCNVYDAALRWLKENRDQLTVTQRKKLARGAARMLLPHSVETSMIFTAPLCQWAWMIKMRATEHADPEIRAIYCSVFKVLQEAYPGYFPKWEIVESPDGIGTIVKGSI